MKEEIDLEFDWEQELYGGYKRLDRERDRRKKRDFWTALDGMSSGVALMVDWEFIFGSAVDVVLPFLELTGERTETFPCPGVSPCGCRHWIDKTTRGELIAACCCGGRCATYEIEPGDVLFHGINMERFGGAIRRALGFAEASGAAYASEGLWEIGTYGAGGVPVYFSMEGKAGLLRELSRLLGLRDGPFLVVTPNGISWSPEVEMMARPQGGGHIALSSVLEASAEGLKSKGTIQPMLANFARKLDRGNGVADAVREIGANLKAIAKGSYELRKENTELKQLQSEGMFRFALRVEAEDFQAFAAVIALGNRKSAAEFLGVPLRSFYDRIERWRGKGAEYGRMLRMLEWRKATDRKVTVPLEGALLWGGTEEAGNPETLAAVLATMKERDGSSYGDILREVLEALQEQDAGNWGKVRDELVGILGEEVAATNPQ